MVGAQDAVDLILCHFDDVGLGEAVFLEVLLRHRKTANLTPGAGLVVGRGTDDRLLCTYGRRAEPFGCRACVSEDGGRTWPMDQEIILRDDAPNTDMGYPATAEIEPGELLTVYYQIDQPGEKVSIQATRWSLAT